MYVCSSPFCKLQLLQFLGLFPPPLFCSGTTAQYTLCMNITWCRFLDELWNVDHRDKTLGLGLCFYKHMVLIKFTASSCIPGPLYLHLFSNKIFVEVNKKKKKHTHIENTFFFGHMTNSGLYPQAPWSGGGDSLWQTAASTNITYSSFCSSNYAERGAYQQQSD